jgi:hypothetical protein
MLISPGQNILSLTFLLNWMQTGNHALDFFGISFIILASLWYFGIGQKKKQ